MASKEGVDALAAAERGARDTKGAALSVEHAHGVG